MAYNIPWAEVDDNPTKSDQASNLDVYVRKVPDAIAERLTNMFSGFAQGETAEGIKRLEFIDQASDPADNKTVYTKGGEAYLKDGVGNIVQLTKDGTISNIPSGTIMLFGQTVAPAGWTKKIDWQDNAMLCYTTGTIGSGGTVNPQNTHAHTTPSHILTEAEMPSHTHTTTFPYGIGGEGDTPQGLTKPARQGDVIKTTTTVGSDSAHAHGNTGANSIPWYQTVIACTKD